MYPYDKKLLRKQMRMTRQLQQISLAAPQVIAIRLMRMGSAGANPSRRDQNEFTRMWTEKPTAFGHAWWDMWQEACMQQQRWYMQAFQLWSQLLTTGKPVSEENMKRFWTQWARQQANAGLSIGNRGLGPVRRRAVSNARRLAKKS